MAPMALDKIDEHLKQTIQHLYELQSNTQGYEGPGTQESQIQKIHALTASLIQLSALTSSPQISSSSSTSTSTSTSVAHLLPHIPPEIIEYVDTGRNPDIYTREFVELVQRGNAAVRGKSEALGAFRDVLAGEILGEWGEEVRPFVERVVGGMVVVGGEGGENGVKREEEEEGGIGGRNRA
ncbi:MAG: RNA polymerase II mediator complex subunit [Icmadophila ericetorum]|nr:RNA polymerase II mediator complex subunit [Icmadophila ericetorum]